MDIRETKKIAALAGEKLRATPGAGRIALIFAAIALGASGGTSVISYLLGMEISQSGGLGKMGLRAMLESARLVLPIALNIGLLFLELGFAAAMLRVARGQYVSEKTLKLGLDRVGLVLKCAVFKGLAFAGILFVSVYLGMMLFMFTPLSEPAVEILTPYLDSMTVMSQGNALVLEDSVYLEFSRAVLPAYGICLVIFSLLGIPVWYSYRMVDYIIIDKPGTGALAALGESKAMMRGKRVSLFKLDLRLWWYYAALAAVAVLGYGDVLLPMLGAALPGSEDVWYFVFLGVYLAGMFGVYYFLRCRVEVSYALAYEAAKPRPKPEVKRPDGIILGNIFDNR